MACAPCSSGSRTAASASASTEPARAPGVVIDADGTWVDGKRVDAAPGDDEKKIEGLYDALKQRRDAARASHPDAAIEPLALAVKGAVHGAATRVAVTCDGNAPSANVITAYEGATSAQKPGDVKTQTMELFRGSACAPGGFGASDPQPIALPDKWKGEVRLGAISAGGALTEADVKAGEAKVHDKVAGCYAARKCVKDQVARAAFPSAKGITLVTLPIAFSRGGRKPARPRVAQVRAEQRAELA